MPRPAPCSPPPGHRTAASLRPDQDLSTCSASQTEPDQLDTAHRPHNQAGKNAHHDKERLRMEVRIKLLTSVDADRHTDSQRYTELRRKCEGPHDRELVVAQPTPSSRRSPFAERMVPHRGPRNNRTGACGNGGSDGHSFDTPGDQVRQLFPNRRERDAL